MMSNGDGDGFQIVAEKPIPDVYTDSVGFEMGVYGVTLVFGQQPAGRPSGGLWPKHQRVRVHMSPQHAKIFAKLLTKNVRAYEDQVGTIPLPKELYDDLKIEESW